MEKIFGYDYDKSTGRLVINEEEADVVKLVFDLKATYNLREDEILALITKELSLEQVINFRIYKIQNMLMYDYGKKVDFGNILEIIKSNENIDKCLVKPLLEVKESLKQEYDIDSIDVLINKIDEVINLLQNKNDILSKYNNFNKVSQTINKLNIKSKNITDWLTNSNDFISVKNHQPIIAKELFEQVKEKLEHNNEIELEEIDK